MVLYIRIFPPQGSTSPEALEDVYTQSLVCQDYFSTLVGMGSHDAGDEPKKAFHFIFCRTFKNFYFDLILVFCTDEIYGTLFEHFE